MSHKYKDEGEVTSRAGGKKDPFAQHKLFLTFTDTDLETEFLAFYFGEKFLRVLAYSLISIFVWYGHIIL